MTGGIIEKNKAYAGGGVLVKGTFDMKGGKITMNTTTNNGKAIMLNYNFHWQGGEIKDNIGSVQPIGYEGGAGNDFHNNTNPRKEPS